MPKQATGEAVKKHSKRNHPAKARIRIEEQSGLMPAVDFGKLGFYGASAQPRPTVTGSRSGNVAVASLLSALSSLGLITDNTTP